MLFSLASFVIAAFIELGEKQMETTNETTRLADKVRGIAHSLDDVIGGKFQDSVKHLTDSNGFVRTDSAEFLPVDFSRLHICNVLIQ
jgi:hypothetical protein